MLNQRGHKDKFYWKEQAKMYKKLWLDTQEELDKQGEECRKCKWRIRDLESFNDTIINKVVDLSEIIDEIMDVVSYEGFEEDML